MTTQEIIGKMTLEEKAKLLCGASSFTLNGFPEYGLPAIHMQDGGTGINYEQLLDDRYAKDTATIARYFFDVEKLTEKQRAIRDEIYDKLTADLGEYPAAPGCYPPGILLGATWNGEVCERTGEILGIEALVYKIGVLLGTPNVNILREPRSGRFFEGYSEDSYLAKTLSARLAAGVESTGVAADAKHFACNNQEINRVGLDEKITERALEEVYFPAFKTCSAVSATVMAAYNSINGVKCTESEYLLTEKLRRQWNFGGAVMTDWGACTGKESDCIKAGCDIFMPGPWPHEEIVEAVREGRLDESVLDEACTRVIELITRCAKAKLPEDMTPEKYIEEGDKAAYEAACEGIILLRNEDGTLPLTGGASEDGECEVALFGCGDGMLLDCGNGSAQVFTPRKESLKNCLVQKGVRVSEDDMEAFRNGALAIVTEKQESREGRDRENIDLSKETRDLLDMLYKEKQGGAGGKICLVLNTPGPVVFDGYEKKTDAIIALFYPGMKGAAALAGIITGEVNPSGALPVSFPARLEDSPSFLGYPDSHSCVYPEGIYVGYKGLAKRGIKPLYGFGHGLSYTKFEITEMSVDVSGEGMDASGCVDVTIANTGDFDGKCVLQIYESKDFPMAARAPMNLIAFAKPFIKAGESKRILIDIPGAELEYYDEDRHGFMLEAGTYTLKAGFGCENVVKEAKVRIEKGSPELGPGPDWSVGRIAESPELIEAVRADIEEHGLNPEMLAGSLNYTPADSLRKVYKESELFAKFSEACGNYVWK